MFGRRRNNCWQGPGRRIQQNRSCSLLVHIVQWIQMFQSQHQNRCNRSSPTYFYVFLFQIAPIVNCFCCLHGGSLQREGERVSHKHSNRLDGYPPPYVPSCSTSKNAGKIKRDVKILVRWLRTKNHTFYITFIRG